VNAVHRYPDKISRRPDVLYLQALRRVAPAGSEARCTSRCGPRGATAVPPTTRVGSPPAAPRRAVMITTVYPRLSPGPGPGAYATASRLRKTFAIMGNLPVRRVILGARQVRVNIALPGYPHPHVRRASSRPGPRDDRPPRPSAKDRRCGLRLERHAPRRAGDPPHGRRSLLAAGRSGRGQSSLAEGQAVIAEGQRKQGEQLAALRESATEILRRLPDPDDPDATGTSQ
jgi:hypothetical protein